MDRDTMMIVWLITFPVIVGGAATLLSLLTRRFTSRECPQCLQRIPKSAFTNSVPCPECGAELTVSERTSPDFGSNSVCGKCGRSVGCVTLWDGKSYCAICIGEQSPQLLNAVAASMYAEVIPCSIGTLAWRMFLFSVASIGSIAGTMALLVGLLSGDWQNALTGIAVILLLGLPVIVLFTAGGPLQLAFARFKVIAWNGLLIVRHDMRLLIAPLADCTWREGKQSQMTLHRYAFLMRGPALIVELPKTIAKEGNYVAVGCTDETREVWRSFFEICAIPHSPQKKAWWSFGNRPPHGRAAD